MSVLIWATVLFAVRSSSTNTVASETPEITAEAGLCVVIPCDSTDPNFSLESAVWYKCEDNCTESDIILLSNNTSPNAQSRFNGRVSLLEPDPSQGNCSIIINDLSESDSGLYQLIPNGTMVESTTHRVTVKGLIQKPTVMNPPLTEGQQTTLTCTAPGLCSGSHPKITWMWRGAGEKDSHITGNITAFKTENLTAVTQRHSSTLTFNASAEHHNTNITCKISFSNNITTEETVTLSVTYVKDPEISGATTVKEGDTLKLTCSVDSYPPSVVTWTKSNLNNESRTDLQSNTGTTTRLIRNVTAEHSGQYICTAKHLDKLLTKEVNITVIYVKKFEITGKRTVKKGDTLNLTCSVDSYPPSVVTWTKSNLNNESRTDLQNNTGTTTLIIRNVTAEHSGQYICTAKHLDILIKEINVTVIYMERAEITGNRTVKDGGTLNLTCNVESSPSTDAVWTRVLSNKRLHKGTETNLQNHNGSASLVIPNVTTKDTGQYICTAKHLDMTVVTVYANVTVTTTPKILKSSGCRHHLGVLTCACISQGSPLPTIKWPLLKSHTEYSVITTVSKKIVNSTITLTVKNPSKTGVECVSSNDNEEVKKNITIEKAEHKEEDQVKKLLRTMTQLEIIIAFLIGALLSAIICCLLRKCHRKKQRIYGELPETLEMVTSQEHPLIDAGQAVEDYQAIDQDAAEAGGAMVAEKLDVEYSDLDFSLIKSPAEAGAAQGTPETEYAEIKKEKVEKRQDGEGEEEEKMIGEDEEAKHCVPDEVEGEDVALYSTVKDVMDEI